MTDYGGGFGPRLISRSLSRAAVVSEAAPLHVPPMFSEEQGRRLPARDCRLFTFRVRCDPCARAVRLDLGQFTQTRSVAVGEVLDRLRCIRCGRGFSVAVLTNAEHTEGWGSWDRRKTWQVAFHPPSGPR